MDKQYVGITILCIANSLARAHGGDVTKAALRALGYAPGGVPQILEALQAFLGHARPAAALVEVSALVRPDLLVEIEAEEGLRIPVVGVAPGNGIEVGRDVRDERVEANRRPLAHTPDRTARTARSPPGRGCSSRPSRRPRCHNTRKPRSRIGRSCLTIVTENWPKTFCLMKPNIRVLMD